MLIKLYLAAADSFSHSGKHDLSDTDSLRSGTVGISLAVEINRRDPIGICYQCTYMCTYKLYRMCVCLSK